jgi:electron transfer flavoprotein alpha/beta subunit
VIQMMNITVLVKPAIDPTSIQWEYRNQQFEFITEGFNQSDLHALQWVCDYKEKHGGYITVLMVVDSTQDVDVRRILKFNIDECILVKKENLKMNRSEVAAVIANELKDKSFDLILSGSESEDTHSGITPAMVAEMLNIPSLTHVHHIDLINEGMWHVQRKEGRGIVQTFQIELPALIGVVSAISRKRYIPRYTSLPNTKKVLIKDSSLEFANKPKVNILNISEPQPNIRYFGVPSSQLLAQQRLLMIMGFNQDHIGEAPEKTTEKVSDELIHFVTQKTQKWLKEE